MKFRRKGDYTCEILPGEWVAGAIYWATPILGSTKGHKPFGWRGDRTNPVVGKPSDLPWKLQGRECGLRECSLLTGSTAPGCLAWAQWTSSLAPHAAFSSWNQSFPWQRKDFSNETLRDLKHETVSRQKTKPAECPNLQFIRAQSKSHCGQTTTAPCSRS